MDLASSSYTVFHPVGRQEYCEERSVMGFFRPCFLLLESFLCFGVSRYSIGIEVP